MSAGVYCCPYFDFSCMVGGCSFNCWFNKVDAEGWITKNNFELFKGELNPYLVFFDHFLRWLLMFEWIFEGEPITTQPKMFTMGSSKCEVESCNVLLAWIGLVSGVCDSRFCVSFERTTIKAHWNFEVLPMCTLNEWICFKKIFKDCILGVAQLQFLLVNCERN